MTFPAGRLQFRAQFERRDIVDDGAGNERGAWSVVAVLSCAFLPSFGVEAVEAGGLVAGLRGVLTLHVGPTARSLQAEDRVTFLTGPYKDIGPCQIRSILPRPDAATIEMNLESGAPT